MWTPTQVAMNNEWLYAFTVPVGLATDAGACTSCACAYLGQVDAQGCHRLTQLNTHVTSHCRAVVDGLGSTWQQQAFS